VEGTITVYHTGFAIVQTPDLQFGRSNTDFGQGFYLSDDLAFAGRWAKARKDLSVYLNTYRLALDGLRIKRFRRDAAWYDYIYANRAGRPDTLTTYDAVIGPIACDTIYDTLGILTSGLIDKEAALKAYRLVPSYRQIVLKSTKAVSALEWVEARTISPEEIRQNQAILLQEEQAYQAKLLRLLGSIEELQD
jgi:hypothetical protein